MGALAHSISQPPRELDWASTLSSLENLKDMVSRPPNILREDRYRAMLKHTTACKGNFAFDDDEHDEYEEFADDLIAQCLLSSDAYYDNPILFSQLLYL